MDPTPLQLGVFDLMHVIGEGGMGEIWLGRHREQGVEVAIKILRGEQGSEAKHRQSFLREVQSFARLLHPGIIRIFDYGEIPAGLSNHESASLKEEAPYIAMELATRGSLAGVSGVFTWRQLRWLLIEVLNALAHAHARRLIHRDLKPDNILLTRGADGQTCIKLTDFGIVHISDPSVFKKTSDMAALYAGTPVYMSPEQLRGRWRDFGPWTDLYALGCVAFEQCCGHLPFEGDNLFDIAHQQLAGELPEIEPRMEVPAGFTDWIKRLLEKNPQDRFQRAADAAWALLKLPDSSEDAILPGFHHAQLRSTPKHRISDPGAPTMDDITLQLESNPAHTTHNTLHSDLLSRLGQAKHLSVEFGEEEEEHSRELFVYRDAPPTPHRWHRRRAPAPSIQLMGAGLGLYGLREIPYVSRQRERDICWEHMLKAYQTKTARAVLVRGSTGVGKTRLMQWIGERAHEVGAAIIMRANHSPEAAPTQGIADMVARQLNTGGLPRRKLFKRIKELLTASATHRATADLDALSLTALLLPDDPNESRNPAITDDGPRAQLNTPRDRYIVLARLLEHLCAERPVFMILDDAHLSMETLEAVRLLLTEPQTRALPLFVMLSINDDAQSIRPASKRLIGQLLGVQAMRELILDPLPDTAHRELVDALLRLEDPLPDTILDLSRGNPMFAVQLVGEWIQREILEPGEHGYRLRDGAEPFLPDTLDQLWGTRLSRLLRTVQQRSPRFSEIEIRTVLEIAASLGQQIDFGEWGHTCSRVDLAIPSALVDAMITQGFATADHKSWSFSHEQIRERLQRESREEGRWEQVNRACAAMIDALYTRDSTGAPERLVNHLIEAGASALAVEPLFYLIQVAQLRNEYDKADQYLEQLEVLLFEIDTKPDALHHGKLQLLHATQAVHTRTVRAARALLERTSDLATQHGWESLRGMIELARSEVALYEGELDVCLKLCDAASEHFAEAGDQLGLGSCFVLHGRMQALQHNHQEAKSYARSAIEISRDIPRDEHPFGVDNLLGRAYDTLGFAYLREQKLEKATMAMKRATRYFKEVGNRLGEELSNVRLGDVARAHGNFDAAERFYLDAHDRLEEFDHAARALPRLDHAMLLLELGRYEEARALFTELCEVFSTIGLSLYLAPTHFAMATCHAHSLEVDAWREHHEAGKKLLEKSKLISPDLALLTERAAEALAQDYPREALDCYPLAIAQLEALGADEATLHNIRFRVDLTMDRLPRDVRAQMIRKP